MLIFFNSKNFGTSERPASAKIVLGTESTIFCGSPKTTIPSLLCVPYLILILKNEI